MAKVNIIPSLVVLLVLVPGLLVGEQLGTARHGGNAASPPPATQTPVKHQAPPTSPTASHLQQLSEKVKNLEDINWALGVVALVSLGFSIAAVGAFFYTLLKGSADKKSSGFSQPASNSNNHPVQNSVGQDYNKLTQLVKDHISPIEDRLEALEQQRRTSQGNSPSIKITPTQRIQPEPVYQPTLPPVSQTQQAPTQQYPSSQHPPLVVAYNSNPDSLSKSATKVSETQESINQRCSGINEPAVLEKSRQGSYWILTEGGLEYLVPKGNIKINEYNYETVEALFECRGYQSEESSEFQVIEPARVSSRGEKWQLVEPGILQF